MRIKMSNSQKHGRWVSASDGDGVVCSVCGEDPHFLAFDASGYKFCPNCGAKMDEKPGKDEISMNKIPYDQRKAVYEKAISKYGVNKQIWKFMEEVAELQEAVCKYLSGRIGFGFDNVAEEIADVTIMLEQLRLLFDCNDLVNEYIDKKVERLQHNLSKEFPF